MKGIDINEPHAEGTMLGSYCIEGILARGGDAVIYRAVDSRTGQRVAIKQRLYSEDNPFRSADLAMEARILDRLDHPGIIRALELFRVGGKEYYYVMPIVEGKSMDDASLYRSGVTDVWMRRFITDMLEILRYLHGKGFVHGDVKPDNILMDRQRKVTLIDFGNARSIDLGAGGHSARVTLGFCPPEMEQGFHAAAPRRDLYALGATCYRVLTGNTQAPPTTLGGHYPPLTEQRILCRHFSPEVLRGIDKALCADPLQSWQSAEEWLQSFGDAYGAEVPWEDDAAEEPPADEEHEEVADGFDGSAAPGLGVQEFPIYFPERTLPLSDTLPVQTLAGHYVIRRCLASARYIQTYEAYDVTNECRVILREYFPRAMATRKYADVFLRHAGDEEQRLYNCGLYNFLNEAHCHSTVTHPHLAGVKEVFRALNTGYCVVPYVEGTSLEALCRQGRRLTRPELTELMRSLLSGLAALHKRHIYHFNIKPSNILITPAGAPVLIGFGSRHVSYLTAIHVPGSCDAGPGEPIPPYMPIEQVNLSRGVGAWSDVYALGCTLYFVLTGQEPILAHRRQAMVMGYSCVGMETGYSRENDPCRPLAERESLRDFYGKALLQTIDMAMEFDPANRWRKAADWEDALEGLD
ncbi:MAG: serine/threonine-protein kinase [Akkermansia sp.]|nr:serine/threonine-protein kinase [Akkermansia sp.]